MLFFLGMGAVYKCICIFMYSTHVHADALGAAPISKMPRAHPGARSCAECSLNRCTQVRLYTLPCCDGAFLGAVFAALCSCIRRASQISRCLVCVERAVLGGVTNNIGWLYKQICGEVVVLLTACADVPHCKLR